MPNNQYDKLSECIRALRLTQYHQSHRTEAEPYGAVATWWPQEGTGLHTVMVDVKKCGLSLDGIVNTPITLLRGRRAERTAQLDQYGIAIFRDIEPGMYEFTVSKPEE